MATSETERVLDLIKRFNNDEKVCIDRIIGKAQYDAESNIPNIWLNSKNKPISERTIGRTLKVLKRYFPNSFELIRGGKGEKACYKAVTKQAFENFMQPEVLSLMTLAFSMASKSDLFENFNLDPDDKKLIEKELKHVNNVYEFKNKPFETTKADNKILKVLESNIKYQKCVIIEYPHQGNIQKIEVKPYKILFINENFYLACEVDHQDYMFSMYRVSKIVTVENISKTYHKNYDIEEFIKDIQTPFAIYTPNYKKHLIDVQIEIDSSKAYFFKAKKHMRSQEILEEKDDGNLIVNFKITQEMEIEDLIKRWIPHMKIIQPESLRNKVKNLNFRT